MRPDTPGSRTSEFALARARGFWPTVSMVLGVVMAVGGTVAEIVSTTPNSKVAIVVGGVMVVAGKLQTALQTMGYVKHRTEYKKAIKYEEPTTSTGSSPYADVERMFHHTGSQELGSLEDRKN